MSLFDSASLVVTPNGVKEDKLYSIKPSDGSGDLVVTRATTATKVNSSGLIESVSTNVLRLDYTNSSCPSILVEPQRTNLLQRSEEFDNAYWVKNSVTVTANNTISPSGIQNADRLQFTGAGFLLSTSQISGTVYTFSCWAKRNGTGTQSVGFFKDGSGAVDSAWALTSEWKRFTYTYTASNASFVGIAGVSGADVFVWGAQFEVGSNATSYIPTIASSVTRNADVISKTGISSLIGQTEGTIFLDAVVTKDGAGYYPLGTLIGATSSIYIGINTFITSGNIYAEVRNTTQQALITSSVSSGRCKIALAYKSNDIALYINGNLIGTDTSATIPATSAFSFEYDVNIANRNKKNFNTVALWKERLSNETLATLTTI